MPSQPSFCMPGKPPKNLLVTSLPRPCLRNCSPGILRISASRELPMAVTPLLS